MHGSNQSNFVATDIKHGEFSDLVGVTTRNQRSECKNQRRIADFGMPAAATKLHAEWGSRG